MNELKIRYTKAQRRANHKAKVEARNAEFNTLLNECGGGTSNEMVYSKDLDDKLAEAREAIYQ